MFETVFRMLRSEAIRLFSHFDRTVTNYFVVTRMPGPALEKENGVRGPFTEDQFDKMATSLSLPAFTKTFDDLN